LLTILIVKLLNYALALEYLEREFYRQGLANYTTEFPTDTLAPQDRNHFVDNLREIYFDERTHVSAIRSILGNQAVEPCTYSFPSTDPYFFSVLASVLEGVGVSA